MTVPQALRYSAEHEWVRIDGGHVTVGVTAYAAENLGDIVFVELPDVGATVTAGEACGEIESTKSVSDLCAPVTGTVTEINGAVAGSPATVGEDPYERGWLFRVELAADADTDALLTAEAYRNIIRENES